MVYISTYSTVRTYLDIEIKLESTAHAPAYTKVVIIWT